MHTLTLEHIDETKDSTVSVLLLNGVHLCYILENGYREVKEMGKTRIPAGTYELFARQSGGFWGRYKERFGHDFVVGFKHIPNYKWVLFHVGNTVEDTDACPLTNTDYHMGDDGNYEGTESVKAYLEFHDILKELFNDGKVFIEIDRGVVPDVPVTEEPNEPTEGEEPTTEEPTTEEPRVKPPIPKAKDIGCGGLLVILLIASLFGAAIASL